MDWLWLLNLGLGANVVLNGRSEISEDLLAQFADYGVTVVGISGDISNGEDAQRMVAEAIEKLGSVDGFFYTIWCKN